MAHWIFTLVFSLQATTLVFESEETMVDRSQVVVEAQVTHIQSKATTDGVTTEVQVRVVDALAGGVSAGQLLTVRHQGGEADGKRMVIFGQPEFVLGERVHLYLVQNKDGTFRTLDLGLGKLEVREENGVWKAHRNLGHTRVVSLGKKKLARSQHYSELKRLVRSRAKAKAPVDPVVVTQPLTPSKNSSKVRFMEPSARWFESPELYSDTRKPRGTTYDAKLAVERAGQAWNSAQSGLKIEYKGAQQGPGFACNEGKITVSFDDPLNQVSDPSSCGGGALAVGGYCADTNTLDENGHAKITAAAVVMNNGWQNCWFWDDQKNTEEVLTHEIGHAVGFAHSWEGHMGAPEDDYLEEATMYWMAHFDGRGAQLKDYDRDAALVLYGTTAQDDITGIRCHNRVLDDWAGNWSHFKKPITQAQFDELKDLFVFVCTHGYNTQKKEVCEKHPGEEGDGRVALKIKYQSNKRKMVYRKDTTVECEGAAKPVALKPVGEVEKFWNLNQKLTGYACNANDSSEIVDVQIRFYKGSRLVKTQKVRADVRRGSKIAKACGGETHRGFRTAPNLPTGTYKAMVYVSTERDPKLRLLGTKTFTTR